MHTWQRLSLPLNDPTDLCKGQSFAVNKLLLNFRARRNKTTSLGVNVFLNPSIICRKYKYLLITLTKSLSSRYYVISRRIPQVLVLLYTELLRNLTLLTRVTIAVLGYPLLKNPYFISFWCLVKSISKEHSSQSLAINYRAFSKVKVWRWRYWCRSFALICRSETTLRSIFFYWTHE